MADMTIFEYLQDHPDSTSSEIAKALNKKHQPSPAHYHTSVLPGGL